MMDWVMRMERFNVKWARVEDSTALRFILLTRHANGTIWQQNTTNTYADIELDPATIPKKYWDWMALLDALVGGNVDLVSLPYKDIRDAKLERLVRSSGDIRYALYVSDKPVIGYE